ncbi:MAG: lysophospholipid acyltransferase family protein [Acidimicrobiales bacterium]
MRRSDLPGATPPRRRLAVTPGSLRPGFRRSGRSFPLVAPTWPATVDKPAPATTLGTRYQTAWARRYPARLARVLVTELVARPAVAALARPSVEGLDRIDHLQGPAIFAANHSSHLDTILLLSVLPERFRHRTVVAAGADYFFDSRAKAAFFALTIAAVPIERRRVSRDSVARTAALLGDGWSLVIYPEGGRSPDGWAQPHTAGAAWLAERSGVPVVPIFVGGTRDILPRGSARLRPGPTEVSFGRPLTAAGDVRGLAARIETAIAVLGDEAGTDWWSARRRAAQGSTPAPTGPEAAGWRRAWALRGGAERPPAGGGEWAAG